MFRKITDLSLCYPAHNNLKYTSDYESVMQFVSNNKTIPAKLDAFKTSHEAQANMARLVELIAKADKTIFNDPVFSHPDCQLYTLALLKDKKISIMDFLDLNIYLSVLMQFTDQQSVKETDTDVKRNAIVKLFQVSELQQEIVDNIIHEHFNKHSHTKLNLDKFNEHLNQLSNFAKIVIAIKITDPKDIVSEIMTEFARNSVLMFQYDGYYYIYSASLAAIILRAINKDCHVKMAPVFGNINLLTLYKMHQLGFHPVSLYSKDVVTNPEKIHTIRIGQLPTLLHDIVAHVYWGNLLSQNHYRFVFDYLIPKVAQVLNLNIIDVEKMNDNTPTGQQDLFNLIDLNIENPLFHDVYDHNFHDRYDLNIYLYFCIQCALGNNREKAFEVFKALYQDRAMIEKEYHINLEEIFMQPFFAITPTVRGSELLDSVSNSAKKYRGFY